MKHHRQDIIILCLHLLIWGVVITAPAAVSYMVNHADGHMSFMFLMRSLGILGPMCLIYMLTYHVLVPFLLLRGRRWLFGICVTLLILVFHIQFAFAKVFELPSFVIAGMYTWLAVSLATDSLVAIAAIGLRSYVHSHRRQLELEEQQRKTTEAELNWLKNQLNPHFLFNSLNNISSLTQIDPDMAQDAIGQLSDLLRYALYESNKQLVPLSGEVEFMRCYIALMRLRCSDKTTVETDFQLGEHSPEVAPLLFISFIENAFKHGTSNNHPSHVNVSLRAEADLITFSCRNSNLPKGNSDHSGSGIGLENTRRRLDLLYPGRYEWQQQVVDDEYQITLTLHLSK